MARGFPRQSVTEGEPPEERAAGMKFQPVRCRLRAEMICPQCRAEYRRGFTVCADCEVPLVESTDLLAPRVVGDDASSPGENSFKATPGDPNQDPFCSFWKGTDLRVCTEICTVLDEAEIPHKTIRRQDHLFNLNNQAPYEIGVPASLYEKAEDAIKNAFGTDAEGAEDAVYEPDQRKLLPNQNDHLTDAGIFAPLMSMAKSKAREMMGQPTKEEASEFGEEGNDAGIGNGDEGTHEMKDLEQVDPADATEMVWHGSDLDTRQMVEMSLRENDIFSRAAERGDEVQIFVLPGDEERAREIVREISDGMPLE